MQTTSSPAAQTPPRAMADPRGPDALRVAGRDTLPAAGSIHLTDGEQEVLLDIAVGLTDQAIAHRLSLSRRGVQNRLASIYRKLGVHRSAQQQAPLPCAPRCRAVFLALQIGLITPAGMVQREMGNRNWLATTASA